MKKHLIAITALILVFAMLCTTNLVSSFALNFNELQLLGDAVQQPDGTIQLTTCETWKQGTVWNNKVVDSNSEIKIQFSYWVGDGVDKPLGGADGLIVMLSDDKYDAGSTRFTTDNAYGVEFDSYFGSDNTGDPNGTHVAILKNNTSNHLKYIFSIDNFLSKL